VRCANLRRFVLPLPGAASGHSVPVFVQFNRPPFKNPAEPRDTFNVAYVTDEGSNAAVDELRVDAITGAVTLLGSVSPGLGGLTEQPAPVSLAVHPSGQFVYTGTGDFPPVAISLFSADSTTGLLTWVGAGATADETGGRRYARRTLA
jgi:hypothetical protein